MEQGCYFTPRFKHDIREPLSTIMSALDLLQNNKPTPKQAILIIAAMESAKHLLELIDSLLDFSLAKRSTPINPAQKTKTLYLINQIMLIVHLQAEQKKIQLKAIIKPNVPSKIVINGLSLKRILINLLNNAIKFTNKGRIILMVAYKKPQLIIKVIDTGIGISQKMQKKIFAPYIQVESKKNTQKYNADINIGVTNNSDTSSMGLGLAIAKELVKSMNGRLTLISALNKGSCFTLYLPLKQQIATTVNRQSLLSVPRSSLCQLNYSLKILVVDDMKSSCSILSNMLKDLKQQSFLAYNGKQALLFGKKHVFDLVIMDMHMPQLNGLQVIQLWRDPKQGILDPDCAIVILSADQLNLNIPAHNFSPNWHLTKPLQLWQLTKLLLQVIGYQQNRGIDLQDLALNTSTKIVNSILNIHSKKIRSQIKLDLLELHGQLTNAFIDQQKTKFQNVLHKIKGIAGQAGLAILISKIEILEIILRNKTWQKDAMHTILGHLEKSMMQILIDDEKPWTYLKMSL